MPGRACGTGGRQASPSGALVSGRRPFFLAAPAAPSVDPKVVALAAMSALGPEDQAAVLAQLGLAACPA